MKKLNLFHRKAKRFLNEKKGRRGFMVLLRKCRDSVPMPRIFRHKYPGGSWTVDLCYRRFALTLFTYE